MQQPGNEREKGGEEKKVPTDFQPQRHRCKLKGRWWQSSREQPMAKETMGMALVLGLPPAEGAGKTLLEDEKGQKEEKPKRPRKKKEIKVPRARRRLPCRSLVQPFPEGTVKEHSARRPGRKPTGAHRSMVLLARSVDMAGGWP